LDVIVSDVETDVSLLGVCAGYESQEWRYKQLVGDFIRWAPDWILKKSEIRDLGGHNMMDLAAKALKRIYISEKYEHRGELGELLLHMILRKFMGADRAISRIFFKDAPTIRSRASTEYSWFLLRMRLAKRNWNCGWESPSFTRIQPVVSVMCSKNWNCI
jgi:hypothetical protein